MYILQLICKICTTRFYPSSVVMELVMLKLPEIHKLMPEIFTSIAGSILKKVTWYPINEQEGSDWVQCREAALIVIERIAHKSIPDEIAKPEAFEAPHLIMISTGNIIEAFMDSNIAYNYTLLEVINERQLSAKNMLLVQKMIKRTMSELRGMLSAEVCYLLSHGSIDFTSKDYQQCCVEHRFDIHDNAYCRFANDSDTSPF